MASLIEAIEIKRKMFFEFEGAPYHCIDVDVSKPTARGGQTLVRIKMRNLLTRAVFDKTFKAGEKFKEPDLANVDATFLYSGGDGYHFMDQETFETVTLGQAWSARTGCCSSTTCSCRCRSTTATRSALQFPPHVELTVTSSEPGARGDTASGSVTKVATLETGLQIRVPLFIKDGEKVKVHTRDARVRGSGLILRTAIPCCPCCPWLELFVLSVV